MVVISHTSKTSFEVPFSEVPWLPCLVTQHLALCSSQASRDLWLLLISVWGCTCHSICEVIRG